MTTGPEPEQREIDVGDGLRLHVSRCGQGLPLVLLHGFTGSSRSWDTLRAKLEGIETITIDLPGHGRSSAPSDPARYALDRSADDLARVLDALALERAAVLGYSLGGRAALRFALRHPPRACALLLESTSPGVSDPAARSARVASDEALAHRIECGGVEAFIGEWERLPLWKSQRSLPAAIRAELRGQRLANAPAGLANSLRGAGAAVDPPVTTRLSEVRAPTLLIAGDLDPAYVAHAHEMRAAMPGARLAIVTGSGHAVHLERPDELRRLVEEFVTGTADCNFDRRA